MKNIYILQTDKPSRLVLDTVNNLLFTTTTKDFGTNIMKFQNIYITSDEEIKEGDCVILKSGRLTKAEIQEGVLGFQTVDGIAFLYFQDGDKKIILTTDTKLIEDVVQAIPDEFLEWFVKNPSREEVKTIKVPYFDESGYSHLLIIPKKETTILGSVLNNL